MTTAAAPKKHTESIAVILKSDFFGPEGYAKGEKTVITHDTEVYEQRAIQLHTFKPRYLMEEDERYLQIIPYCLFTYQESVFLMQRGTKIGEQRLASKGSLGIGGHIRYEDVADAPDSIALWGVREFEEEVFYTGGMKTSLLGIVYDDTNPVGRVHVGFVYHLEADSSTIAIKEEFVSGELVALDACKNMYDRLENWSKIAYDLLAAKFQKA